MAWFAVSLILPVWAAYAPVAYCDRETSNGVATRFFRVSLAIGIGVGISSGTYFLWLFFMGVPGKSYHACELAAFAIAGLFGWVLLRFSPRPLGEGSEKSPRPLGEGTTQWLLLIAFLAALTLAAVGAVGIYWQTPLGDWDAWTIWNQRARFLFRAGPQWRQAFSPEFAHTDYPLLLPCSNARLWSYLGTDCPWAPWLLGTLLTFATVGVLVSGVCRLRSRSQGLLAGLVLLGMVSFVQRGALQYADVPLSFFFLSAVMLFAHYDVQNQSQRAKGTEEVFGRKSDHAGEPCPENLLRPLAAGLLVLSGLLAGLAAWTKNEGALFLVVLPAARCAATWRRRGARQVVRELGYWTAGALPVLALVALEKLCLAGSNDLVDGQNWQATVTRLLDPYRYWYVAQALALNALRIARPFAVVLSLCFLLLGVAKNRARGTAGLPTAGAVLPLMLAGYFLVYVTTPCDLHWHLATSAGRLLLHLWPLCIMVLFLCLATPEESWAEESPPAAVLSRAPLPARPH